MKTINIMFVCHGNICRSPMAEMIFRDMVQKAGLTKRFSVSSSATSSEEIYRGVGNPVYPQARRILLTHGIDPGEKRAVQLTKRDYDAYDLFVAMDERNVRNIGHIFGSDPAGKVQKLMRYAGEDRDVADPWYTGDFETAYRDIYDGCAGLLERLCAEKGEGTR